MTTTVTSETRSVQAFASIKNGARNSLPSSSATIQVTLESSAILNVTAVTLRNLPYILAANQLEIYDLCHFISSRINYFEVAMISVASLIHHFAVALFYTALTVISLGQSESLNFSFNMHWCHTVHCVTAFVIGLAGTLSPSLGALLTGLFLESTWNGIINSYENDIKFFEDPLLKNVKTLVHNHYQLITNFIQGIAKERYPFYERDLKGIKEDIITATKIQDLIDLTVRFWNEFPNMFDKKNNTPKKSNLVSRSEHRRIFKSQPHV